jgi:hypothetical protein
MHVIHHPPFNTKSRRGLKHSERYNRKHGDIMAEQIKEIKGAEKSVALEPKEAPRNSIAEWVVTILLLLFGTTTLVQAFVIPTGSMEDTLCAGGVHQQVSAAVRGAETRRHYRFPLSGRFIGDLCKAGHRIAGRSSENGETRDVPQWGQVE